MIPRRFVTIDALRGVAALAVVLTHTVERESFVGLGSIPYWLGLVLDRLFSYGRVGVTLFFCISGFCIHLRWARSVCNGRATSIDFKSFWKRRFLRLYPPFLVAMLIYLVVQTFNGLIRWDAFEIYNLVSHLLMIHNFDERTIYGIEGVFWTLAIEEQLYLAYFVLLFMRNRWGWGRTLLVCIGGRFAWFILAFLVNKTAGGFRLPHEGGCLAHWFVWALGAVSIEMALGITRMPKWSHTNIVAIGCFAAAIASDLVTQYHLLGALGWRLSWVVGEPLWGVGIFVMVNRLIVAEARWRALDRSPRPVVFFASLGLFSYSTYLMHHFVLLYIDPVLSRNLGIANSLASKLLFLPLCYALSWVFFAWIERPFIPKTTHGRQTLAREVVLAEPAPALS